MRAYVLALALGYVLPAFSVLKRVANVRDDLPFTALKAEGPLAATPAAAKDVAALLGVAWTSGDLTLTGTWSLKLPGRCRLDLTSPESSKALAYVSSNGKKRQEGGDWPAAQVAVDEVCALLALHSGNEGESRVNLEKHLAALKIDTKTTTLGRLGSTIVTIIGDRATPGAPQLWVTKDRYQPARVKFSDEAGIAWDVRFYDYGSPVTNEWLPRRLEVQKGDEVVLKFSVLSVDGKPQLDAAKF